MEENGKILTSSYDFPDEIDEKKMYKEKKLCQHKNTSIFFFPRNLFGTDIRSMTEINFGNKVAAYTSVYTKYVLGEK